MEREPVCILYRVSLPAATCGHRVLCSGTSRWERAWQQVPSVWFWLFSATRNIFLYNPGRRKKRKPEYLLKMEYLQAFYRIDESIMVITFRLY